MRFHPIAIDTLAAPLGAIATMLGSAPARDCASRSASLWPAARRPVSCRRCMAPLAGPAAA